MIVDKMADNGITGKVIAFVVAAFLLFVGVQLLWHRAEEKVKPDEERPAFKISEVKFEGRGKELEIGGEDAATEKGRASARRDELRQQLRLLEEGNTEERQRAAWDLVFIAEESLTDSFLARSMADESAAAALLTELQDAEEKVAEPCAEALIKLWQRSDSPVVNKVFHRALSAYEAGRSEKAMTLFDKAAELDAGIPDLYRVRGQIWLASSRPENALKDCQKAVAIEKNHFYAYYLMALCHVQMGNHEKALESVTEALCIYRHFKQAQDLIHSLVQADEL